VSPRTFVELIKSILKVTVVTMVVYFTLRSRWDELMFLMFLTPLGVVKAVSSVIAAVWLRATIAMILLGILDFGYQYWQHRRDQRMTPHEAKVEMKQLEGDPKLKQRIRNVQRQLAMQRMMKDVETADVIITNPIRFAVAIRYDLAGSDAPTVVSKGARLVAKRIRELAVEHDVPIVEKPELARALHKNVEVGQTIPEDLFAAVAEVLAFVYKIDRREEKRRERAPFMSQAEPATQ
jgi:flagellar biosynthetic protein FlhB